MGVLRWLSRLPARVWRRVDAFMSPAPYDGEET